MRVTNAIREYVSDVIRKKYDDKIHELRAEYDEERESVREEIEEVVREATDKALQIVAARGFEYRPGYRNDKLISMTGNICKPDVDDFIDRESRKLRDRERQKTKQVLFDLEMGQTAKAELIEILDGIEAD